MCHEINYIKWCHVSFKLTYYVGKLKIATSFVPQDRDNSPLNWYDNS